MNFKTILDRIFEKIKLEKDVKNKDKAFNYIEECIKKNPIYRHQFELLTALKEGKKNIKTSKQLENFLKKIRNKNHKFISENKVSSLKIWNQNKKLLEYYNINPETIIPCILDKAIDVNPNKKLNEEAIKSYIGKISENKVSRASIIKESFKLSGKSRKNLNTNFKIVRFFAEGLDNTNKSYIHESLTKLRTMQKDNFNECVSKLYKLRLTTEKLLREFQKDDTSASSKKHSPSRKASLKDLKYIKSIQIFTPRNYKDPEEMEISFRIPFYPIGARFNELRLSAIGIKKKVDSLERVFVTQCINKLGYKKLFSTENSIWQIIMREAGIKVGRPQDARVTYYLNGKPGKGNSWEMYVEAIYECLKEFQNILIETFPEELTPQAQKAAIKNMDPNRVRAKRQAPVGKDITRNKAPRKSKKSDDEIFSFGDGSDDFGGMF